MKRLLYFFTLVALHNTLLAQVLVSDIGGDTPDPSAVLELRSTDKGFLLPRLTKAEREAIQDPAKGLMIYLIQDNTQCLQVYDGLGWADIYCPSSNTAPVAQDVSIEGLPIIGETLTGTYTYLDADGDQEESSVYNWYTIESLQDTNYVSLNNHSNSLLLTNDHKGKYIVFGVTPKAISGAVLGVESYSAPIGKVGDNTTVTSDANINEFHYDNEGQDSNEFVEIRVKGDEANQPANIQDYKIIHYNGNGGKKIDSQVLSNLIKNCDAENCYYTWEVQLQNGPDGLALINNQSEVVEFISYEGEVTATEAEASGYTSTDVGVSEVSSTPINSSIFLDADGTWKLSEGSNTKGQANY